MSFFKTLAKVARASNEKSFDRSMERIAKLERKWGIEETRANLSQKRKVCCNNCKYYKGTSHYEYCIMFSKSSYIMDPEEDACAHFENINAL